LPRVSLTDKKAIKQVLAWVKAAGATTVKYARCVLFSYRLDRSDRNDFTAAERNRQNSCVR
jgi:hypothetical protein